MADGGEDTAIVMSRERCVIERDMTYDAFANSGAMQAERFEWRLIYAEKPLNGFVMEIPVIEHLTGGRSKALADQV